MSKDVTAVQHFGKSDPLTEPVDKRLTTNLRTACARNEERKRRNRDTLEQKKSALGATAPADSKRKACSDLKVRKESSA